MFDNVEYLTREGYKELKERLDHLRDVRRQEIANRLRSALDEGGDLAENAEYDDAKREQAFIEGEIYRLEGIFSRAEIIERTGNLDIVELGAFVTIVEDGTSEKERYQLVGAAEANPQKGKISNESPMGQALLGQKKGKKVTVIAPAGDIVFKIVDIE